MKIPVNFSFNGIAVSNGIASIVNPSVMSGSMKLIFGVLYQADIGEPLIKSEVYECDFNNNGTDIFEQAHAFLMSDEKFSKQII